MPDWQRLFSNDPAARDDPNQDRNDRQHEQQVDEPTKCNVQREAEYPYHDEYNSDCPQ